MSARDPGAATGTREWMLTIPAPARWLNGPAVPPEIIRRILGKVDISENGCWDWMAAKTSSGYGVIRTPGSGPLVTVHRVTYAFWRGEIPDGLDLDHLCRNRGCVNPDHLEAVTRKENLHRGARETFVLHEAGVCRNGHPASAAYRRKSTGIVVYCRICKREKERARRAAK